MKLLLVLIVVLGGLWLLRRSRAKPPPADRSQSPASQPAISVVHCALCGVHVPQDDAVAEGNRWFCCIEHQRRATMHSS